MKKIPKKFEDSLSDYGPKIFDSWCGEPVGWGYKIIKHLGDERFSELKECGEMNCIYPNWYLITKKLTREDAIKKYGEVTDKELGPRGGFISITFGDKKFGSKCLDN